MRRGGNFQSRGHQSRGGVPPKGSKGILFTCDVNRTNNGVGQAMHLLEKYLGQTEAKGKEEMSLEDELKSLNAPKQVRFVPYVSEVSGNVFIRFANESDSPLDFMEKYFASLSQTGQSECPLIPKIYPILYCGFPISDESLPALEPLLPLVFDPQKPVTFEILIQRKHKGDAHNETHEEVNDKILAKIGSMHKPVFHNAQVGVLWQSLGRNLYIGVVPKWGEWCSCNIPKYCAKVKAQKAGAAQEEKRNSA